MFKESVRSKGSQAVKESLFDAEEQQKTGPVARLHVHELDNGFQDGSSAFQKILLTI